MAISVSPYSNTLRRLIKHAGYTFREVAEETKIPERTLYDWAAGNHVISRQDRIVLARVLGCTVQELAPWEEMQGWEQQAAIAVNEQVGAFVRAGYEQGSARLTREQGGRLVSALWNVEVYRNYPEKPKLSYVAPYDELPKWQQETDADIYAAIETRELTARQGTAY